MIPVQTRRRFGKFRLSQAIKRELDSQSIELRNGDIVVVSSKFAAMAEGRFMKLDRIVPSERAEMLSTQYNIDLSLAELVVRESETILGGIEGFALAVSKGILAPNAGIDRSNVPMGYAILYPSDPQKTADRLRDSLLRTISERNQPDNAPSLGIVLSDSRITPTRLGTIGIAIAAAGFSPVQDFRGQTDLFGNRLKVTLRAVADELASAAQLVMGEAAESVPVVIVRGCKVSFGSSKNLSMLIPYDQCLYIQGLMNRFRE